MSAVCMSLDGCVMCAHCHYPGSPPFWYNDFPWHFQWPTRSSRGSVVKATDLHPANLGSTPAGSRCPYESLVMAGRASDQNCSASKSPTSEGTSKPLSKGVKDEVWTFWHFNDLQLHYKSTPWGQHTLQALLMQNSTAMHLRICCNKNSIKANTINMMLHTKR